MKIIGRKFRDAKAIMFGKFLHGNLVGGPVDPIEDVGMTPFAFFADVVAESLIVAGVVDVCCVVGVYDVVPDLQGDFAGG